MALIVSVLVMIMVGLALVTIGAVAGWRRERQQVRLLAERLMVEGRLEMLTIHTLQAMRQAARDHLAGRAQQ